MVLHPAPMVVTEGMAMATMVVPAGKQLTEQESTN